jgi:transcriptional regulator with XRE-family HTH domain
MPLTPMVLPNGPLVRELRRGNRWTQQKLARRIHRTHAIISRIESGRPVSEAVMEQVARAFKVELSEIATALPFEAEPGQPMAVAS